MAGPNAQQLRERQILAKPKHIREWADRAGVLPRYMVGGFWNPGGKRKKRHNG